MSDFPAIESKLKTLLNLTRRPVAIRFSERAPEGMPAFRGKAPAGCSFWKLAAEGRRFFTAQADHYNCAIGCHTHRIDLPQDRAPELEQTLSLMEDIGYLKMEEVPDIARLEQSPSVVEYSPLAQARGTPDVVLLCGHPQSLSLVQEAAWRIGAQSPSALFGRPTCMALPAAMRGEVAASTACIGNRVYTQIDQQDLYIAIGGGNLDAILQALVVIVDANQKLRDYHQGRAQNLSQAAT
ncbi:MAG: DUF169 domain-containing protein [Panacagrimonas sp.]